MRRRLVLLAVAVSLMVALAFVVPLAFLVRDLAADRALAAGDRRSQEIARVIAALAPERGLIEASRAVSLAVNGGFATSLVLPGWIRGRCGATTRGNGPSRVERDRISHGDWW